jgi:hypothetical protein
VTVYQARRGQVAYGYTIGMICAEWHIPFIPGDLNNATTFPFPVRYVSVAGAAGAGVLKGHDPALEASFVAAAQQLESEGVRAITSNCGFMAAYQPVVARSVKVPVFLSSLVQVPMLIGTLSPDRKLGVLVANASSVNDRVLRSVGIRETTQIVFQGLDGNPHWDEVILQECGLLDEVVMRREVVATAQKLVAHDPSIGALLLECSDLPPYSNAVAAATGLPVFDWANFIYYVHRAIVPPTYDGFF